MFRALAISACLLATLVPATLAAEEERATLPAWLEERLAAEGMVVDASDVQVLRTLRQGGETLRYEVPLSALPANDPFSGTTVAPGDVPEVLVGQLTQHIMLQIGDCSGYGAQEAAAGMSVVQDASWPVGIHLALGPAGGGVAASTGGDPATNLILIFGVDSGMTLAAGDLAITEDRITIFGTCLALLGQMSGTGAWNFS